MEIKKVYRDTVLVVSISIMLLSMAFVARSQTPSPQGKPVTLKFNHHLAVTHPGAKAIAQWAADIKAKSQGEITVEVYPAGQLYTNVQAFDAIGEGAIQLSTEGLFGESGKIPVTAIYNLPYVFNSFEGLVNAGKGGLDEIMNVETEKKGVKVVSICFIDQAQWFSTKKLLKRPEDFKGARLRIFPGFVGPAVEAMGGAAVTMPLSDVYTSLQRGVVDGHIGTLPSVIAGKFYEIEKHGVIGPFVLSAIHIIANLKTWNGLSKSQQDLISKTLEDMGNVLTPVMREETLVSGPALLREKGVEVYVQKPEEVPIFKDVLKPVYDMYLKIAGPQGEKALEIVRKYNK